MSENPVRVKTVDEAVLAIYLLFVGGDVLGEVPTPPALHDAMRDILVDLEISAAVRAIKAFEAFQRGGGA